MIRKAFEQFISMDLRSSKVAGRSAIVVRRVHVRPFAQESSKNLAIREGRMIIPCDHTCGMQRSSALTTLRVDVRSGLHQHRDQPRTSILSSQHSLQFAVK